MTGRKKAAAKKAAKEVPIKDKKQEKKQTKTTKRISTPADNIDDDTNEPQTKKMRNGWAQKRSIRDKSSSIIGIHANNSNNALKTTFLHTFFAQIYRIVDVGRFISQFGQRFA